MLKNVCTHAISSAAIKEQKMPQEKRTKICCVFNYASFYRRPIYSKMDTMLDCDFFFGDTAFDPIKPFDATALKGFKGYIKAKKTGIVGHIWHSGIRKIFKKRYTHYILIGNPKYIVNWLIIAYAHLTGKKVYLWTHGVKKNMRGFFNRLYHKLFYTGVTGNLMYNRYNCQYMEELGCKSDTLHIIHNSLDTEAQTSIYNRLRPTNIYTEHFGNTAPTIIYIGRIQKSKRIDQILHAIKLLKEKGHIINAILVGASVDDDTTHTLARQLGIENQVWIYGPSFDEEKNAELLYNAAACVSPSNIGLTAVHSLTYGTPVITNDYFNGHGPEFEAITDGITGSFFKENDTADLADKIEYWCNIAHEERQRCRKAARNTVESEWSVAYQTALLTKLFN